jgi:hypothetical protein
MLLDFIEQFLCAVLILFCVCRAGFQNSTVMVSNQIF